MLAIYKKHISNGAHEMQTLGKLLPGWAWIPSGVAIPYTAPFVFIDGIEETEQGDVVTGLSPNVEAYEAAMADQPEPEEPTDEPTSEELLNILMGVSE